jgi:hypothetical protein
MLCRGRDHGEVVEAGRDPPLDGATSPNPLLACDGCDGPGPVGPLFERWSEPVGRAGRRVESGHPRRASSRRRLRDTVGDIASGRFGPDRSPAVARRAVGVCGLRGCRRVAVRAGRRAARCRGLRNGTVTLLSYLGLPTKLGIAVLAPMRPLGRRVGPGSSAIVSWKIQAATPPADDRLNRSTPPCRLAVARRGWAAGAG